MRYAYEECVVPRIPGKGDQIKRVCFLILTVLSAICAVILSLLFAVPALIFGFLYYRERQNANCEYEYVQTNNIFDVDLVSGNASRKQLVSLDLERVILLAPKDSAELAVFRSAKEDDYSGNQETNLYIMVYDAGGQKKKLILQLNEKMLGSLKQWLPGKVK